MLRYCWPVVITASVLLAISSTAMGAGPQGRLLVGTDAGVFPQVKGYDYPGRVESASFFAYDTSFSGGVRVAAGDVNGDGVGDIVTGTGPGGGPHVKVFSGSTGAQIRSLLPYTPSFTGGVYVASGDINGDGYADIITGAGAGGSPQVIAFDGLTQAPLLNFFAYDPGFTGGVRVATGDVNGDGKADVITSTGSGGGPQVKIFNGATGALDRSFFSFDPSFTGGVFVAAGDINGDGLSDIVAGTDAGGRISLFSGTDLSSLGSFFPYGTGFAGGVRVAAGDIDGDGRAELVTGNGAGAGQLQVFRGTDLGLIDSFMPYGPSYTGGIFVAAIPEPACAWILAAVLPMLARRRCGVRSA